MASGVRKFNPGFLTDDEIVDSFCVRDAELESILESLRDSTGSSNVHTLVIGPRGTGKTHLLLRVVAEIRRSPDLSGFCPIVFSEESYEVSTVGEFWLECLGRLAGLAPDEERDDLRRSHDDLRALGDDRDLADRCLAAIMDFADRHGKRMVLFVENLNMLFSDMADPEAGWRLRHTLQTEPRIVLLGSATSRFDEIDRSDHALYELFRVVTLRPLGMEDCAAIWQAIAGSAPVTQDFEEIRPLEILTGGNTRLVVMISSIGAGMSFAELMARLLELIDEHTEYFKGHLEALPAQERRVYLALARLWKPATAKDVAGQVRLSTNVCSALLKRLVDRGAVAIEGGTPRRRRYYLAERLHNVYYLLRSGGGKSRVVRELVDFMVGMYSPWDLWDEVKRVLHENRSVAQGIPLEVTQVLVQSMMDQADAFERAKQHGRAVEVYDEIIRRLDADGGSETAHLVALQLIGKGSLLVSLARYEEVTLVCDEILARFGSHEVPEMAVCTTLALAVKTMALTQQQAVPEALQYAEQAMSHVDLIPTAYRPRIENMVLLAQAIALNAANRTSEAVALFDRIIQAFDLARQDELAGTVASALSMKGAMPDQTLTESEVATLLSCMAQLKGVDPGSINALVRFSAVAGASPALELIEASGTTELLLPLVTALRQEMGEETHIAKEVAEIASDVQRNLARLRANVQPGSRVAALRREVSNST